MVFTSFAGRSYNVVSDQVKQSDSFDEIPMIDLSQPQAQVVDSLRDACTRVGFFSISNHSIPQSVIDQVFSTAAEFFSLDDAAKQQAHFKNGTALCGYEGFQNVYTDETKKPDLNEAFSWRYGPDMDQFSEPNKNIEESKQESNPDDKKEDFLTSGQNIWPNAKPEMRRDISQYYSHLGSMGKILHYPPQRAKGPDPPFGIGAHTDIECFTILCQGGDVPALQVLNPNGEWILVPPIRGTFVVNIGDMLARWSNDTFRSTIHRVLNITGQERYSLPVFIGPSYQTIIQPLETCLADGAKYDPIPAGLYVWKRLAISRLDKDEYEKQLVKMENHLTPAINV
ncbi:Gibberellin 2-beta-dioxygenase 1 [Talaromyces islandicus]|uniref:Gibberellin 2-beta-dioxygenase 1 n=1 Tax=Talaromyces islandicus TaxID=28573 RepID=A0A0U1M8Y2_TALIS|nr:Gibberellin 2-beta-dioxygenase 1 [Talaromyces islandicus]